MARRRKRSKPAKKRAGRSLRRLSDPFRELRFEPEGSSRELIAVILLSLGALATGAGIYAQWFWRAETPPAYAPLLLGGGILLCIIYAFYSPDELSPLVVGELGVGFETKGRVTRTAWYQVERLSFAHGALVLKTAGKPIQVPLKEHPDAASLIVAEAQERIPKRVELDESDIERIGPPSDQAGIQQEAEPPQVTDLTCRATEQPLTIEKDVRMCARCCALYHRKGIPRRCEECRRILKTG